LINDFKSKVPKECIVLAAVKDEAKNQLSQEAKNLFKELGSKEIQNLGFRQGWSFISIRHKQGQVMERRGNPVKIWATI
jgi:hypothetical protein